MRASPVRPTVDFEKDGVQHGSLKLPWSRDDSAWGALMTPVAVIKNGDGATALLTGGNHGDEYEGPIALVDLARRLNPAEVTGRLVIVPMMNYAAFGAARRTSPIDGCNMNRIFPGRPDGTVTEKIADYFQRHLLPLADYVLDIHSGGRTLDFVPFAACHVLPDKQQEARCIEAMEAFAAPYCVKMLEIDAVGMYDSAAEEMGKVFVTTELGGGGSATAETARIAKRGVWNFLRHAGIVAGEPERVHSVHLDMPDERCFVTSESAGLLEMLVDLGEPIEDGDIVARVHDTVRTGVTPREYRANVSGILAGRHFPGLVQHGDTIAVIATVAD